MMTLMRRFAVCAAAACFTVSASYCAPVVDSPAGQVEGKSEGTLLVFKGIPYAEPPVGPARWKPPAQMPRWQGVRQATAFGPACFQPTGGTRTVYTSDPGPMSEDCLTLNIWAPANAHNAPVLFWIHGGALLGGSSREALYDGARLAQRGIIVISINYRLGVLGFLAHPELSAESQSGISGNYGILDQIEALRWVKRNIAAFGGDAANVTIDGQSAGGLSVMYLLASPPARGLFAKAIAQSAYMVSAPELKQARYGSASYEQVGVKLAGDLDAANIAALRAMDARTLVTRAAAARFPPFGTVDGQVLPRQLVEVFDRGEQAPVPIVAGFNAGELRSMTMLAPHAPATPADYTRIIRTQYREYSEAFLQLYPANQMRESILAATRDALYGWTAERLVRRQAAIGQPSYFYIFDHSYAAAEEVGLHAFHAAELPYIFGDFNGTPPDWPKVPATPEETRFSEAMIGYWTSFVRSGRPQAAGAPDWPAYGRTAAYMAFRDVPTPSVHLMPGMFEFNEAVVCRRRVGNQAWNWNVGLWSPSLSTVREQCP
jgi:para-nitrobenzyl esterase